MAKPQTFFYFGYGSNLLAQRIHIKNPTATRVGAGKLKNYQLDFLTYSKRWRGASATIIRSPGRDVWGAVWEIDIKQLQNLDDQEGVKDNIYFPMDVDIELIGGKIVKCRVYEQCNTPEPTDKIEHLKDERKPSLVYLQTIQKGAKETGLPAHYQQFLDRIPHNGYNGMVDIGAELKLT